MRGGRSGVDNRRWRTGGGASKFEGVDGERGRRRVGGGGGAGMSAMSSPRDEGRDRVEEAAVYILMESSLECLETAHMPVTTLGIHDSQGLLFLTVYGKENP